jgi:ATP phosphoribosyltransferase
VILRSEANLVAALAAPWSARARAAARAVLTRMAAEEEARTTREVRAAIDPARAAELAGLGERGLATLPYGLPRGEEAVLHCRTTQVFELVAALQSLGAHDVTVRTIDYLFRAANPLTERLMRRIG